MSTTHYPVLVIGAGPVGLSVALSLLQQGVPVLVFEQRPKLALDPRATTIQPPTLEMLRELGVLEAVEARSRRVDALQYWSWSPPRIERLAQLPLSRIAEHAPLPYRLHCAQPDLCAALAAAVDERMPGAVQLGQRVTGFHDLGPYVDVDIEGRMGKRRVRGAWLVAADGAGSTIRKQLELPVHRLTGSDTFFTCETGLEVDDAMEEAFQVRFGDAAFAFTPAGWTLFMRMRDSVRLLFLATGADASALGNDALFDMTRALFGRDPRVELLHRAVYTVRQQVVERWRVGRAVVLGDAAHTTFPVSGTAMNAGIHDGYALARALPRGDEAVDAWAVARRDAVRSVVNAHANETYKALNARGLFSRPSRDRYLRSLERDEVAGRDHLLRASMLAERAGAPPELTP